MPDATVRPTLPQPQYDECFTNCTNLLLFHSSSCRSILQWHFAIEANLRQKEIIFCFSWKIFFNFFRFLLFGSSFRSGHISGQRCRYTFSLRDSSIFFATFLSLSYLPTYIGTLLPIFLLRSSLPCSIPILFTICLSFFCFISLYYTYQPTSVHCYLYFSNICLYHVWLTFICSFFLRFLK